MNGFRLLFCGNALMNLGNLAIAPNQGKFIANGGLLFLVWGAKLSTSIAATATSLRIADLRIYELPPNLRNFAILRSFVIILTTVWIYKLILSAAYL